LPGRVAKALILLVAGLATSCLLLVPGQGTTMVVVEVLAVGLAAWGWVGAIQLLRLKDCQAMPPELRQAFVLRVALGQVATLPFIAAGIVVLTGGLGGLYRLAACMVFVILVTLFDAWVLLIEIKR
jgi:hypothetical protein